MTVGMLIDEEKEKSKKEGIAQGLTQGHKTGLKEGLTQGKIEAAIIAIKEFNLPIEQVAIKYDIPIEELKEKF